MTHLRELFLNNNVLRVLPYELGKLFLLQTLGLSGEGVGGVGEGGGWVREGCGWVWMGVGGDGLM